MDKTALRDAATVILVRDPGGAPSVLMGQRGETAAFMPNRFVFPGGAMDAGDRDVPLGSDLDPGCVDRMDDQSPPGLGRALAATAIRELWEETGLRLAVPGVWPGEPPEDWHEFAAPGCLPAASALSFVFRAITPKGRPRRFDARFFVADADALLGDLDDFSRASDELSHLQWIPLQKVRDFHLPFVTEVVLAEVTAALPSLDPPETVPFFDNGAEESLFRRLGGIGPMQAIGAKG
ncbi:NUDIX hydrolase [Psychromarinibacter sp. S121]|uniref:NUDIX hydrolase n=1 Tax=Psychromarinibacter sp. S121 TaxID=3415127 RepID=UPI003C7CE2C3